TGGFEHPAAVRGVHRHPRLAEHVLALLENGLRDLTVHVRPGPDAHSVDVLGADEVLPALVHLGDPELARDALAGLLRAMGHGDQLDAGLRAKPRDVPHTRVVAGADEAYADRLVGSHGATL